MNIDPGISEESLTVTQHPSNLFEAAATCLGECDTDRKIRLTRETAEAWQTGVLAPESLTLPDAIGEAGRPERPHLVPPRQLPRRSAFSDSGRAALIHAIAHIEFNAINLAWDAVYRFREMPRDYYSDWIRVACEEAYHFTLLRDHLRSLGYDYGAFEAHNGLWEMAVDTAHDALVRMALVPRVLEARGLDVTPGIMQRLRDAGDQAAVDILEIILRDEIGHVAIGTRWYRHLCEQRDLEPDVTFRHLIDEYMKGRIKGPLYREARRSAGFSDNEMDYLETL